MLFRYEISDQEPYTHKHPIKFPGFLMLHVQQVLEDGSRPGSILSVLTAQRPHGPVRPLLLPLKMSDRAALRLIRLLRVIRFENPGVDKVGDPLFCLRHQPVAHEEWHRRSFWQTGKYPVHITRFYVDSTTVGVCLTCKNVGREICLTVTLRHKQRGSAPR